MLIHANIKISLIIIVIIAVLSLTYSSQVLAFSSIGFNTPFGGKVTMTMKCTCNNDQGGQKILVYVGSPKGGTFIKNLATRVYKNNAVSMGNWVLGLAGTNEQCQMQNYYPYFCYTIGQGKAITMVGTSGFGFGF